MSRYQRSVCLSSLCLVCLMVSIVYQRSACIFDLFFWAVLVILVSQSLVLHDVRIKKQQDSL
ncbi:hypothetical protein ACE4RV_15790 [Acetobacter persici]|uniref:hypothetical protein n=1 Tax=Acetobacter persici TaxID=1076596 RepID=UPI0036DC029D